MPIVRPAESSWPANANFNDEKQAAWLEVAVRGSAGDLSELGVGTMNMSHLRRCHLLRIGGGRSVCGCRTMRAAGKAVARAQLSSSSVARTTRAQPVARAPLIWLLASASFSQPASQPLGRFGTDQGEKKSTGSSWKECRAKREESQRIPIIGSIASERTGCFN